MSDLTRCNYCDLLVIKSFAKEENKKVKLKANKEHGGIDVFVDKKFVAWFMELTDHCVC